MKKTKIKLWHIIIGIIIIFLIFNQNNQREGLGNTGVANPKSDIKLNTIGSRASSVGGAECATDYSYNYYAAKGKYQSGFSQFCYTNSNHIGVVLLVFPIKSDGSYDSSKRVDILKGKTGCVSGLSGLQFDYNLYWCDTIQKTCTETKEYYTDGCCDENNVKRTRQLQAITTGGCDGYCDGISNKCTLTKSGSTVYQSLCLPDNGAYAPEYTCHKPSCTPNCQGKVCGDDGCGGNCGTCQSGYSCSNGACVTSSGINKDIVGTLTEVTTPICKVEQNTIICPVDLINKGSSTIFGVIELQPGNPRQSLSRSGIAPIVCNPDTASNNGYKFSITPGENLKLDLKTTVGKGRYTPIIVMVDKCCPYASASDPCKPIEPYGWGKTLNEIEVVSDAVKAVCGNGQCEYFGGENHGNCPYDCGGLSSYCGDGWCDPDTETIDNCPEDKCSKTTISNLGCINPNGEEEELSTLKGVDFICKNGKWVEIKLCRKEIKTTDGRLLYSLYKPGQETEMDVGMELWKVKCDGGKWEKIEKIDIIGLECKLLKKSSPIGFNLIFINSDSNNFNDEVDRVVKKLFEYIPFKGNENLFNIYITSPTMPSDEKPFLDKPFPPERVLKYIEDCPISNNYVIIIDDRNIPMDSYWIPIGPENGFIELFSKEYTEFGINSWKNYFKDNKYKDINTDFITDDWIKEMLDIDITFVHEFGHQFGKLDDEYISGGYLSDTNCDGDYDSNKECDLWDSSLGECIIGCTKSDAYRPSEDSIMRGGGQLDLSLGFNDVSIQVINKRLKSITPTQSLMATISPSSDSLMIKIEMINNKITISDITLEKGGVYQQNKDEEYTLRIVSDDDKTLYETTFNIDFKVYDRPDPTLFDSEGNQIKYPEVITKPGMITVITPYFDNAFDIEILKNNELLTSRQIPFSTNIETTENIFDKLLSNITIGTLKIPIWFIISVAVLLIVVLFPKKRRNRK